MWNATLTHRRPKPVVKMKMKMKAENKMSNASNNTKPAVYINGSWPAMSLERLMIDTFGTYECTQNLLHFYQENTDGDHMDVDILERMGFIRVHDDNTCNTETDLDDDFRYHVFAREIQPFDNAIDDHEDPDNGPASVLFDAMFSDTWLSDDATPHDAHKKNYDDTRREAFRLIDAFLASHERDSIDTHDGTEWMYGAFLCTVNIHMGGDPRGGYYNVRVGSFSCDYTVPLDLRLESYLSTKSDDETLIDELNRINERGEMMSGYSSNPLSQIERITGYTGVYDSDYVDTSSDARHVVPISECPTLFAACPDVDPQTPIIIDFCRPYMGE